MDEAQIRKKARSRASLFPGTGYALLGYQGPAFFGYAVALGVLAAIFAVEIRPGPVTFWLAIGVVVLTLVVQTIEYIAIGRLDIHPTGGTSRGRVQFAAVSVISSVAAVALAAGIFLNFGAMLMAGPGMAPVVQDGERFIYAKHVEQAELVRGALATFELSERSAWGYPGVVVFARILAVPGDELSTRNGRYLVNGMEGPAVSPLEQVPGPVTVPEIPGSIQVPPDYYFMVQEQAAKALDSQSFSWIKSREIISTRHWLVSLRGLFLPLR